VGLRAGELARTSKVYQNTVDRDRVRQLIAVGREQGRSDLPGDVDPEEFNLGVSGDLVTTRVDVSAFVDHKRAAMVAHASQISADSFFLAMPAERFAVAFGQEDYILCGAPPGTVETDLFEGL